MSRLVRHLMMALPPIEPGWVEFWSAGTYDFRVPTNFNFMRVRLVGAGGGGYLTVFGGSGPGTAGGDSTINALGLRATGGGGNLGGGRGTAGTGSGGDINNTGYLGNSNGPGTPVPGLGGAGVGGRYGGAGNLGTQWGHGAGYTEILFTIGDWRVLPNSSFQIVLGRGGHSSGYAGNTVYWGADGGCVIDWQ